MGQVKAPEKIYMTPSFGEPDNVLLASFSKSHLNFHRDIEYTRTDAFIEKACEYFRTKKKCIYACIGEDVYHSLLNEEEIEDFKNYMKGE